MTQPWLADDDTLGRLWWCTCVRQGPCLCLRLDPVPNAARGPEMVEWVSVDPASFPEVCQGGRHASAVCSALTGRSSLVSQRRVF